MKTLPFLPQFKDSLLSGRKRYTSRTRKMGAVGEVMDTIAGPIEIIFIEPAKLGWVAETLWAGEGCNSPDHFISVWEHIHPKKGYDPDQTVYLHSIRRVETVQPKAAQSG